MFRVIPETAGRVAVELTTGGIRLARALTPDQTSVIEDAGMTALSYPDGRASSVLIDTINEGETADAATGDDTRAFEALTDVRVLRQALNYRDRPRRCRQQSLRWRVNPARSTICSRRLRLRP